jgi:hypothetical protein
LNRFALDVRRPGTADDVDQTGPANLCRDDLGRQGDAGKQPGEVAAGVRVDPLLFLLDVLLGRDKRG